MNDSQNSHINLTDDSANRPVYVTPQEIAKSNTIKASKPRTFRQLQVVRDASNLAYVVAQIEITCPRKCRCLVDELERLTTEMLQVLDLANENMISRYEMCNDAHSCVMALAIKLEILSRIGGTSKDIIKKTKNLTDSLLRQITGWRNSTSNEGSASK